MHRELNAAERTLFSFISYDIRKHPNKYRSSGKWLDRYYEDEEVCRGRYNLELLRQIKRIETARAIDDADKYLLRDLRETHASQEPPPLWMRLKYALEDLWLDYRHGGVLAEEDARAILLIAWVSTDPNANRANLNITKFAELPWKAEHFAPSRIGLTPELFLGPKPILSRTHFFEWDNESFLRLVFVAWQTLFQGTFDDAWLTKEMRRALLHEKRLLGIDEQESVRREKGFAQNQEPEDVLGVTKTSSQNKEWKPPKGYVGSKTILSDYKVPRTTLQGWHERDMANGKLKNIRKDPQTNENYYPQKWFDKHYQIWQGRKRNS
jgi:hypothetical protein